MRVYLGWTQGWLVESPTDNLGFFININTVSVPTRSVEEDLFHSQTAY